MRNKVLVWVLAGTAVVLVGSQLVPVDTTNPPPEGAMVLPAGETGQLLKAACMDCHSHETVWPWYAHVTPVKFLVASHVNEGRSKLNLSTWAAQSPSRQSRKLEEIAELVLEGEMPEGTYTWMHPGARLTDAQRQVIVDWANAERARLQASGAVPSESGEEGEEGAEGAEGGAQESGEHAEVGGHGER